MLGERNVRSKALLQNFLGDIDKVKEKRAISLERKLKY